MEEKDKQDQAPAQAQPEPAAPTPPAGDPVEKIEKQILEEQVVSLLKTVFDPEIPVNIYELGMIYGVETQPPGEVKVRMTLTSPACPVAGSLPGEVKAKLEGIPGVRKATVDLVWEPPWNPSMMSEAARLELGFF